MDFFIDPEYNDIEKKAINEIITMKNPPIYMNLHLDKIPRKGRKVYYREDKKIKFKSSLHLGQRKLFLSEVRLLYNYCKIGEPCVVVYAGAASGIHIKLLSQLFPNVIFYLYDPAKFDKNLIEYGKKTKKVFIYNDFFTDDVAKSWNGKCDLFISDIRLVSPEHDKTKKWDLAFETQVGIDMDNQKNWTKLCNAKRASMLKFRIPYIKSTYMYLPGKVMMQTWAPLSSTELRLVVEPSDYDKEIKYNCDKINNFMAYFNMIVRQWGYYFVKNINVKGFDYCHDCMSEYIIWIKYIYWTNSKKDVSYYMNLLSNNLGKGLYKITVGNAHGFKPNKPMYKKRKLLYSKFQDKN